MSIYFHHLGFINLLFTMMDIRQAKRNSVFSPNTPDKKIYSPHTPTFFKIHHIPLTLPKNHHIPQIFLKNYPKYPFE